MQVSQSSGQASALLSTQSESPATQSSLLTYDDSDSAVFPGQLLGTASYSHSVTARAAFGNLGSGVSMSISGDFAGNPVSTGFADVSYTDLVTYSDVQGTPFYLRVTKQIHGSGGSTGDSGWGVSAQSDFGNARFLFDYACPNFGGTCSGRSGLNPINTGSPVFTGAGQNLSVQIYIPLSMIQPTANSFSLYSYLGTSAQLWQNGLLGPDSSTAALYGNSSLLGGFQLLDENLNPVSANFSSQSGFDYTQTLADVPEPATITLLGFGFLGILLRKRP